MSVFFSEPSQAIIYRSILLHSKLYRQNIQLAVPSPSPLSDTPLAASPCIQEKRGALSATAYLARFYDHFDTVVREPSLPNFLIRSFAPSSVTLTVRLQHLDHVPFLERQSDFTIPASSAKQAVHKAAAEISHRTHAKQGCQFVLGVVRLHEEQKKNLEKGGGGR